MQLEQIYIDWVKAVNLYLYDLKKPVVYMIYGGFFLSLTLQQRNTAVIDGFAYTLHRDVVQFGQVCNCAGQFE
jgi:hypothetical protein